MNWFFASVFVLFFAVLTTEANPWANFKLPDKLLKFKKKSKVGLNLSF